MFIPYRQLNNIKYILYDIKQSISRFSSIHACTPMCHLGFVRGVHQRFGQQVEDKCLNFIFDQLDATTLLLGGLAHLCFL